MRSRLFQRCDPTFHFASPDAQIPAVLRPVIDRIQTEWDSWRSLPDEGPKQWAARTMFPLSDENAISIAPDFSLFMLVTQIAAIEYIIKHYHRDHPERYLRPPREILQGVVEKFFREGSSDFETIKQLNSGK